MVVAPFHFLDFNNADGSGNVEQNSIMAYSETKPILMTRQRFDIARCGKSLEVGDFFNNPALDGWGNLPKLPQRSLAPVDREHSTFAFNL